MTLSYFNTGFKWKVIVVISMNITPAVLGFYTDGNMLGKNELQHTS